MNSPELGKEYELASSRILPLGMIGPVIEVTQMIPSIYRLMPPEPLDITNHGGNMWGGFVIATTASLIYAKKNENDEGVITQEAMSRFRKFGVAAIMGTTALMNCVTETKWGVQHFPVDSILAGGTPDPLDTIYSTIWSGILSFALWKKSDKQAIQQSSENRDFGTTSSSTF